MKYHVMDGGSIGRCAICGRVSGFTDQIIRGLLDVFLPGRPSARFPWQPAGAPCLNSNVPLDRPALLNRPALEAELSRLLD